MTLDGEHARRVIELLADILADALELTATAADGRLGLVMDMDTWKVRRKRRPARFVRRVFGLWLGGQPLQLEFDGGQVGIDSFIEQALLLVTELLASGRKLPAFKYGHFVRELRELRVAES
ncbi:hypothetical protein BGLT_04836 [Caballeronia glathei]|nr:hypothetical protein BGLT_04836 [Caballeronia glathei]